MIPTDKNSSKTQGRWTKQEHQNFLLGIKIYGKDWKKIQDLIKTRNGAQIRSHAQKFFLRMKKQFEVDPSHQENQPEPSLPSTVQSQTVTDRSQESNDYSYFVQKIVKKSHEKQRFDFWQSFIDQKSCDEIQEMQTGIGKRKSSFTAWDEYEIESMCQFQGLKRVKTE